MKHFSEYQVTSALLDIVPAELEENVLVHLARCGTCEMRTETAIERYRALRREALSRVPPPPRLWRDIEMEMDRADRILGATTRTESPPRARRVWTGVAATAALGTVLLLWPRPDADLRAETLLPRIESSVAQGPSRARQGLRVRTSAATFVRPARLGTADNSNRHWREKFRAAQYDWNDPVSPRVYAEWRASVKHKSDRVIISAASAAAPKRFTIQTTAPEDLLQDASLTVDAATLLPVSAKFVFSGDEWIEISVIPDFSPEAEIAASSAPPLTKAADAVETGGVPPQLPAVGSQAASELAVWLLADRLNEAAAEPIRMDIRSGTRISVTPYSLNARQLQQFSSGLRGMPDVDLHSPNSSQAALEEPPERDPMINLSETISSRAHLLADLATHFPEAIELNLSLSSRIELWELRSRHATQLEQEIRSLDTLLNKPVSASPHDGTSEITAEMLAQEAGRVNRSVVIAAAGQQTQPVELGHLKDFVTEYASSVAHHLEKLR